MAGVIMPKEPAFAAALTARLKDFVVVVLLPLFFAYSGVRTQIGLLNTWNAWLICGVIIVVACVGKFGGTALAARVTGMSWREASVLGLLTNTRGLMELIVLNIGLDLGVITPQLFTAMVLMALVTTVMTSPIVEWLRPGEAAPPSVVRSGMTDPITTR
jgi:Kef-type K+ transport system membrane component KefB